MPAPTTCAIAPRTERTWSREGLQTGPAGPPWWAPATADAVGRPRRHVLRARLATAALRAPRRNWSPDSSVSRPAPGAAPRRAGPGLRWREELSIARGRITVSHQVRNAAGDPRPVRIAFPLPPVDGRGLRVSTLARPDPADGELRRRHRHGRWPADSAGMGGARRSGCARGHGPAVPRGPPPNPLARRHDRRGHEADRHARMGELIKAGLFPDAGVMTERGSGAARRRSTGRRGSPHAATSGSRPATRRCERRPLPRTLRRHPATPAGRPAA